jgi:hypothetical protein
MYKLCQKEIFNLYVEHELWDEHNMVKTIAANGSVLHNQTHYHTNDTYDIYRLFTEVGLVSQVDIVDTLTDLQVEPLDDYVLKSEIHDGSVLRDFDNQQILHGDYLARHYLEFGMLQTTPEAFTPVNHWNEEYIVYSHNTDFERKVQEVVNGANGLDRSVGIIYDSTAVHRYPGGYHDNTVNIERITIIKDHSARGADRRFTHTGLARQGVLIGGQIVPVTREQPYLRVPRISDYADYMNLTEPEAEQLLFKSIFFPPDWIRTFDVGVSLEPEQVSMDEEFTDVQSSAETFDDVVARQVLHDGQEADRLAFHRYNERIRQTTYVARQIVEFEHQEDLDLQLFTSLHFNYPYVVPTHAPHRLNNKFTLRTVSGSPAVVTESKVPIAHGLYTENGYIFDHSGHDRQGVLIGTEVVQVERLKFYRRIPTYEDLATELGISISEAERLAKNNSLFMRMDTLDDVVNHTIVDNIVSSDLFNLNFVSAAVLEDDVSSTDEIQSVETGIGFADTVDENWMVSPTYTYNGTIPHTYSTGVSYGPDSLVHGSHILLSGIFHNSVNNHDGVSLLGAPAPFTYDSSWEHDATQKHREYSLPIAPINFYYDGSDDHNSHKIHNQINIITYRKGHERGNTLSGLIIEDDFNHDYRRGHHHGNHKGEYTIRSGEDYLWRTLFP